MSVDDDTAVQAVMTATTGPEIAAAAWKAFEEWRALQPEEFREKDILEQAMLYFEAEMGDGR